MDIEFRSSEDSARVLDPRQNFAEITCPFEVRSDPLLGDQCRLLLFRFTWKPLKPDLSALMSRSLPENCPFCPQNLTDKAARFVPDLLPQGKLSRGEATVIPNLAPYNKYGAVAIISQAHFLDMAGFHHDLLTDAFELSLDYIRRCVAQDQSARYLSISWNYMPQAGAGQLHPHIQVQPDSIPFNYERRLYQASKAYMEHQGSVFFHDLVQKERSLGQRYVGTTGRIAWLTPYVPVGIMPDVQGVFQERESILDLTSNDISDMVTGLLHVLHYFDEQGYYAFNLAIISGLAGEKHTWTTVRIVPRVPIPPLDASDHHQMSSIHDEPWVARLPEEVCLEIKKRFATP